MDKEIKNNVRLTSPLIRNGVEYPIGTEGYLYGASSAKEINNIMYVMIIILDKYIAITNEDGTAPDFKYEPIN